MSGKTFSFKVHIKVNGFKTRQAAKDYLEEGWCDGIKVKFVDEPEKPKKPLTEGQKRGIAKRAANRKAKMEKSHKDFAALSDAIANFRGRTAPMVKSRHGA